MRKLMILVLCLFLTGCWITPEPPEPNEVTYRGFFVGVSKYENGWTLPSPAKNTESLKELFGECKFGDEEIKFIAIETLVNLDATKENILNGILSVFAESDNNDVSYFYYMGHGGKINDIPVITPSDFTYNLVSAISVHELEATLSLISGTKVIFLETCHAGNFIDKNKNIIWEMFTEDSLDLLDKEGYQVLASSRGDQYTWDSENGSYFCNSFIEGCENLTSDTNNDGIVDLTEIYTHIRNHVPSCKQAVQIYPLGSTFPIVEY